MIENFLNLIKKEYKMTFDYTSDLHLDFYFDSASNVNERKIRKIFDKYFEDKQSKYLLVAGDIGHYVNQNLIILNLIKKLYEYEDIFTVEGNHSGYMVSKSQKFQYGNGKNKIIDHMKILSEGGIKVLDGNSYNIIDNDKIITIGGANSWYDGSIYYQKTSGWYSSSGGIESHWKNTMNDSEMMNIKDFYDIVISEKEKLKKLINKCDIMVTHVKPVCEQRFFQDKYKDDITSAYYSFDWIENIINDEKLKIWVYGHTHETEEWDVFGKKLVCNALGYPKESNRSGLTKSIKSFDI
jgi:Icc-related predicted phosphoesterase